MLFKERNKCLQPNPNFIYDEACIDIVNRFNSTAVTVWGQYTECHQCDYENLTRLEPGQNASLLVSTRYPINIYYESEQSNKSLCGFTKLLAEHYRYEWNITEACRPAGIKVPADSAYLPILTAFIVLFCFGTCWYMVKCIYKNSRRLRYMINMNAVAEEDLGTSSVPLVLERQPSLRKHPHRIKSIDVFRGFCIIVMIFVNYGGGKYWFFAHSPWNGLTIADLVFPWFMWLMGLSLTVSLQAKLRIGLTRRQLAVQVVRRACILVLLGVIINSNQNLQTIGSLRFPGVLQRFGITYLAVGMLEVFLAKRIESENASCVQDLLGSWIQWSVVGMFIVVHTCVTFFVDVPNCGRGYLGPGGRDEHGRFFNCTGGAAGLIDRNLFGEHMYKHPRCEILYETRLYYDPEGLLGTFTSLLIVYAGVQAGRTLNTYQNVKAKVIRWVIWGLVLGLIGGALCEFKKNDGLIPINKQLWSLSFVLVLSGMAFIIFAFLFVLIDISRKWGGRPFFYPGMNAIVLYVGHELFKNTFPFAWTPTAETHGAYLFMNLWGTAVWVAISIFLYKRNVFLAL